MTGYIRILMCFTVMFISPFADNGIDFHNSSDSAVSVTHVPEGNNVDTVPPETNSTLPANDAVEMITHMEDGDETAGAVTHDSARDNDDITMTNTDADTLVDVDNISEQSRNEIGALVSDSGECKQDHQCPYS